AVGPGQGLDVFGWRYEIRIIAAEQADLVGGGRFLARHFHRKGDRSEQNPAGDAEAIHRAGADQRFDRAAVDLLAVDAFAEVEQVLELAALFARGDDRLDRALAAPFHAAQAVTDVRYLLAGDRERLAFGREA